jgi:hypothetical protein
VAVINLFDRNLLGPRAATIGERNTIDCTNTIGDYKCEKQSEEAFKSAVNLAHWIVHSQVRGWLPAMGHREGNNGVRIDFVLEPKPEFISNGWTYGFIGIECKVPLTRLGPVIAQASDYASANWKLKCGRVIVTRSVFIWRSSHVAGNVLSWMMSRRVGTADLTRSGTLLLGWGPTIAYADNGPNEAPRIAKRLDGGNKKGSR